MGFYDYPPAENAADRLDTLRSQRLLILALYEEISAARRTMVARDPDEFWNSPSQCAFALCLADVVMDLDLVLRYVDEALASVRAQIECAHAMCRS